MPRFDSSDGSGLPSGYAMQAGMDRLANGGTGAYQLYGSAVSNAPDWDEWDTPGPNRSNPSASPTAPFSLFNHHHHHHHHSPPPPSSPLFGNDRDTFRATHSPITPPSPRATLWWGELEPWMDDEYAKQVCALMAWDPVSIKVPHPTPDPAAAQHPNNPGYCFLTFPTAAHANAVLAQVNNGPALTMPNSAKPFVLNWAATVPSATTSLSPAFPVSLGTPQYPKEYSIFVGDLAPETSNSDLVAVFRNPVLGLRNDREPKFIRPFLSCKSAKIMLDPVTGVSRGYGFVRFTDEADQQRALVEMHGLYCLSRPMRISPATAKFKPTTVMTPHDLPQVQFPPANGSDMTIAVPLSSLAAQAKSVSAPIAAANSNSSLHSASSGSSSSIEGSSSGTTLSTNTSASSGSLSSANFAPSSVDDMLNLPNHVLAQIAKQYATGERDPPKAAATSITSQFAQDRSAARAQDQRYYSEESWKHHAQAQAILGNLIGPNGEQLTSTDPYNTTVFVGGLSPLISEETLRTFFAPFGDIHYVKVPVGKHCGFVQFVRKADAERAIEKMQGFPVGGSRIRLSWGRSQYKAAQAAAQAAQSAAMQSHIPTNVNPFGLSQEQLQAIQLQLKMAQMVPSQPQPASQIQLQHLADKDHFSEPYGNDLYSGKGFSPFSPEPSTMFARRDSYSGAPIHPKDIPPYYRNELEIRSHESNHSTAKATPSSTRPTSANRYGSYLGGGSPPGNRAPGRPDNHISRPHADVQELDAMHDLNGTLASLDLDRPWKSPAESSDSGVSVQFQMTMNPSSP